MARFSKGKGKKISHWEIDLFGTTVRTKESPDGEKQLSGYENFETESAAQDEAHNLVRKKLNEKYEPADESAKALTGALPLAKEKPAAKPATLPLRQDVYVYNEASGFLITSGSLAGAGIENGGKKWDKAVKDGKLIPVSLFQDDPFVVRVVAGEDLSAQEGEEWTGVIASRLILPDGVLAITGGSEYLSSDYEEGGYFDSFIRTVQVPSGVYDARVYSYLPGVNGIPSLDQIAGGYQKAEKVGKWFRRTRPGEKFPEWLQNWCIAYPSDDPGHDSEWERKKLPEEEKEYVHFVVHLTPAIEETPEEKKKAKTPSGGWYAEAEGARLPSKCPLGLEAKDVIGYVDEDAPGGCIHVFEVDCELAGREPFEIDEELKLPVRELYRLFDVASLAHPRATAALVLSSSVNSASTEWPNGVVPVHSGKTLKLYLNGELCGLPCRTAFDEISSRLSKLNLAGRFELSTMPQGESPGEPAAPTKGTQKYWGTIEGGELIVTATYPRITAAALKNAIALASEVMGTGSIKTFDKADCDAILKQVKRDYGPYLFEDNPLAIDGEKIKLRSPDPELLWLLASCAFAARFKQEFPGIV